MEPHVREWDRWMRAVGEFYDYRDTDRFGRVYQVHRRTVMPAMRVCREWGFASSGREDRGGLREPGVNRLAGVALLIHELLGQGAGDRGAGVRAGDRCLCRVDGQSVFADAFDAVQSVDLAYDALINEVDAGKMRVFLSDVMFDQERAAAGRRVPIPFGKGDCTVFRKVMSTEDTIQEFAPALRTEAQGESVPLGSPGSRGSRRIGRQLLRHGQHGIRQDGRRGVIGQQRAHEEHQEERERAARGAHGRLACRYGLRQVHGCGPSREGRRGRHMRRLLHPGHGLREAPGHGGGRRWARDA